jgi:hypothetical protein
MQKHKIYILHTLISLWLLLLPSCINEIEFDETLSSPILTVNCMATPDTIIKVNLTKSRFFLSTASSWETATNYTVKLWLNGKYKEQLTLKNSQFQSKYKPLPGDFLRLEIICSDSTKALTNGFSVVPVSTPVLNVDTSSVLNEISYLKNDSAVNSQGEIFTDTLAKIMNRKLSYAIQFKDSSAMENFYRVKVFIYHTYEDGKISRETLRVRPDDIIFDKKNESDIFDNDWDRIFNIFSDELIDGKKYTVDVYGNLHYIEILPGKKDFLKLAGYKFPVKSELVIDLMGIDNHTFNYLKTVKYNNTDLQYFSEPVQIYTNISGGVGIFGSYTHNIYKINLPLTANIFYSR